jgi:hypothetical protein
MLEIDRKRFWKFVSENISPENFPHPTDNEKESSIMVKMYLHYLAYIGILESRQKVIRQN